MSEKKPVGLKIKATDIGEFEIWLRWNNDVLARERLLTVAGAMEIVTEHPILRQTHWVDFEIWQCIAGGGGGGDGSLLFGSDVSEMDANPENVTPTCHGFVKWDGCTQFWFEDDHCIHVDSKKELEGLFGAILRAREEAGKIVAFEFED